MTYQGVITLLWGVWMAYGLGLEAFGLLNKRPGDLGTDNQRRYFRRFLAGRLLFYPPWCWLTWHFLFDPHPGASWVDGVVVALGVVLAFVAPKWKDTA